MQLPSILHQKILQYLVLHGKTFHDDLVKALDTPAESVHTAITFLKQQKYVQEDFIRQDDQIVKHLGITTQGMSILKEVTQKDQ